jgi:hypothetical protein
METTIGIVESAKNQPPFDNRVHMADEDGNAVRFVTDPLDERYIEPPGDNIPQGMLPPEEFQVRAALAEMKFFTDNLIELGIFGWIFRRSEFRRRHQIASEKQQALRQLVACSREHRAALRRIVNAMPERNGGREALADYLK